MAPRQSRLPVDRAPEPGSHQMTSDLLDWYDRHRRALPWRALPGHHVDPYAVWLSEIMLQQTTVQAVKPYFAKFLQLWPTVGALAAAPIDDVMRAWAGLGYYSRARNLHACAITVAQDHRGRFPDTETGLRALPGIGPYTAAAIAAIAFGRRATVVDGNVERVMTRFHAIDAAKAQAHPRVYAGMTDATPAARPGDFAQAVMDLGATICTPKSPACTICPLTAHCAARRLGLQADLPRRKARTTSPIRHGVAYYVTNAVGEVLLRRRPARGLLGGMAELPGTEWIKVEPGSILAQTPGSRGRVVHVFTHFTLLLDVCRAEPASIDARTYEGGWWVAPNRLEDEALPTLMRHAIEVATKGPVSPTRPTAASRTRRKS